MSDTAIKPIAYRPAQAVVASGQPRTRIFNAIKNKELTAHKDGNATIIFDDELRRWLKSFKTIGRDPDGEKQSPRIAPAE
jgi:hypothetical protein